MLNSATMASINFFLLNKLVKKRSIDKLEHMTNNSGYLLALDLLNFVHIGWDVDSTCMFGAIFEKCRWQLDFFPGEASWKNNAFFKTGAFILNR